MRARPGDVALAGLPPAARFVLGMAAWTITGLAVVRLPWVDDALVQALVDFQRTLALWYGAAPSPSVVVNSSCSGADQMALCLGVTLAYPVAWWRRLAGASAGLLLVLVLNTARIGTLLSSADSPRLFQALHEYVWPALLMAAVAAYVMLWIRWSEGARLRLSPSFARFALHASFLLLAYALLAPWTFTHSLVVDAGGWTARAGAALLAFTGAATAHGNVLVTSRGAFQVTPECLITPLIPLYLAAALTWPPRWRIRALAAVLALPLFFALSIVRLLVLALPPSLLDAPLIVVHGFFQLVLGVAIVGAAAWYGARPSSRSVAARWTIGLVAALAVAAIAGRWWNAVVILGGHALRAVAPHGLASLATPADVQGALALMPVYQVSLLTGVWLAAGIRRAPRYVAALSCLLVLQVLTAAGVGEVAAHFGVTMPPLIVRAWAVALPLALVVAWTRAIGPAAPSAEAYRRFWNSVGEDFPLLTGAASTRYYRNNEIRLLTEHLPNLAGSTLFKTDLWDEAKNTRILQWAAGQGARVYGIDLSAPIVDAARRGFDGHPVGAARADVRELPFAAASFDAIYSMGTVEHFPETEAAVHELARVLKPGGRLILGVPNLHDPFLRPLLVWALQKVGRYGYGDERAFSRAQVRRMLQAAGLEVVSETGILFMPGWLRMLDLWGHAHWAPLTRLTGPVVAWFEALDRRFAGLRRHGYLLATVATKPAAIALSAVGVEYVVDAHGCDPSVLRSRAALERLSARIIQDLGLRVVGTPIWHAFPGHAGVTGLILLAESHLSVHTFPERGYAAWNLYCCRAVTDWPWQDVLRDELRADEVFVRTIERGAGIG